MSDAFSEQERAEVYRAIRERRGMRNFADASLIRQQAEIRWPGGRE